ncbi:MAG TPA: DUF4836 family protein [Chitinophagaceae bacterium]|nr:DUF4836 family protein [Chitinophagaceae bacterium]
MNKIHYTIIITFFMGILYSCNKVPNHIKYIPKDAVGVFSINMDNLSKKMIWNLLTGSELFEEMQKDFKNENSKNALKDVSNIGLDPMSVLYAYYLGEQSDNKKLYITMAMKDQKKFESFLKNNYPNIQIQDAPKFRYGTVENKLFVSWNKEVLIAIPILTQKDSEILSTADSTAFQPEDYRHKLEEIYILESKNSIKELPHFMALQKADHDFSVWLNYEQIYRMSEPMIDQTTKMFLKDKFVEDAALAVGFDFEKGTVGMDMDYFFSKELASIYKKNINNKFDESLLQSIPSKSLTALLTYSIKPQLFQDILKEFKLEGLLSLALAGAGLTSDDLFQTFNGDVLFAVTDLKEQAQNAQNALVDNAPEFDLYYAMSLNNSSKLQKILQTGVKQNVITKDGDVYKSSLDAEGGMMFDQQKLVYSNKIENTKKFFNEQHNTELLPSNVYSKVKSNPITFYVDLQKISQMISGKSMSDEDKDLLKEFQKLFTYAIVYGGKMKGNANHFEGNLFFENKNENAMIQLLNLAMKAKKIVDKKEQTQPSMIDTLNV